MAQPLSEDLRERVVAAVDRGAPRRAVADRFGIAASTVTKWVQHVRRTGSVVPCPQGGDRRSVRIEAHAEEILGLVAATPDIALEEIATHLAKTHSKTFSVSTVWRCLDRHGLSFKKSGARQRAGASRRRGRT